MIVMEQEGLGFTEITEIPKKRIRAESTEAGSNCFICSCVPA